MNILPNDIHKLFATQYLSIPSAYTLALTCRHYYKLYPKALWQLHNKDWFQSTVTSIGAIPLLKRLLQETNYTPILTNLLNSQRKEEVIATTLRYTSSLKLITDMFGSDDIKQMQILGIAFYNNHFVSNMELITKKLISWNTNFNMFTTHKEKGEAVMRAKLKGEYFSTFMVELVVLLDDEELVNDLITFFINRGISPKVVIAKAWSTGALNFKRFNFTAGFIAGPVGKFQKPSIVENLYPYIIGPLFLWRSKISHNRCLSLLSLFRANTHELVAKYRRSLLDYSSPKELSEHEFIEYCKEETPHPSFYMTGPYPGIDWCIENNLKGVCIQTEYIELLERLLVLVPETTVVVKSTASKEVLQLVAKFENHLIL